jgi:uncharacterized protein (DUF1697 family)
MQNFIALLRAVNVGDAGRLPIMNTVGKRAALSAA